MVRHARHKMAEERIEYEMRSHARARKIQVTVYADGRVVVTKPSYVPDFIADLYVQHEREWIRAQLSPGAKQAE